MTTKLEKAQEFRESLRNQIKSEFPQWNTYTYINAQLPTNLINNIYVGENDVNEILSRPGRGGPRKVIGYEIKPDVKERELSQARNAFTLLRDNPTQYAKNILSSIYERAGQLNFSEGQDAALTYAEAAAPEYITYLLKNNTDIKEINDIYSNNVQQGFNAAKQDAEPSFLEKVLSTVLPIAVTNILAPGLGSAVGSALGVSSAAGQALLGQAAAAGLNTAIQGGNLEDVVKAAATAAAGTAASNAVGSAVSGAIGGTAGSVAGAAASSATRSGIRALIMGDNPNTPQDEGDVFGAILQGATTGGLTTGLNELGGTLLADVPAPLRASIISAATAKILGGNAEEAFKNTLLASLAQEIKNKTSTQELINKAYNDSSRALDLLPEADKAFVNQLAEQDIAYAQEIYGADTGQRLTDAQLREAFSQGKPFDYIDNLYTTEAEAKDIWKATVGTEPTEYDLLGLIGLDTGQVTKQTQDIAYDRSNVSSEELDAFLRDVGKGQITLTAAEKMDLLGGSEVAARNAIAGKYNEYVTDFNQTTADEAQQRWVAAGNTRQMTPEELTLMTSGNQGFAETVARRVADFEQVVFNGNSYNSREAAQTRAKEDGFNEYTYGGRIYQTAQEVPYDPYKVGTATSQVEAAIEAAREGKNTYQWGDKVYKLNNDFASAQAEIDKQATFGEALAKAQELLGNGKAFSYKDQGMFTTPTAVAGSAGAAPFDATKFDSKAAAALAANQAGSKTFTYSDGKTYQLPDNFVSLITPNQTLAETQRLVEQNATLVEAEKLRAIADFDAAFGPLAKYMPPGSDARNLVASAIGGVGNIVQGATGLINGVASVKIGAEPTVGLSSPEVEDAKKYGVVFSIYDSPDERAAKVKHLQELKDAGAQPITPSKGLAIDKDNPMYKLGEWLETTGVLNSPEAQQQKQTIVDFLKDVPAYEKPSALAAIVNNGNWLGAAAYILEEIPQEGAALAATMAVPGSLAGKALLSATLDTSIDAGKAWNDRYEDARSKGKTEEQAAFEAFVVAGITVATELGPDYLADKAMLKVLSKEIGDTAITTAVNYGKGVGAALGMSFASGYASEYASAALTDWYDTGKMTNWDKYSTQGAIGAFTEMGVAGTMLGAVDGARAIGKLYDGTTATVKDLLNSNPNLDYATIDRTEPIFDIGGNGVSLDQIGTVVDRGLTDTNFSPISYITNLTNLGEAGYIDVTAPEVALTVTLAPDANTLTTQLRNMGLDQNSLANVADTKFDSAFTSSAEAKQIFADLGYTPTDAEIAQFVGQKSDADQAAAVGTYVDQNTVTEAEARAALKDSGIAEPTQEMINSLVGQYSQTQLATKANEMISGYMTAEQTNKAISDAIKGIQFPEGITKDDVTDAITDYLSSNPGLSVTDVTKAVATELAKQPTYATPTDVTNALDAALKGYATKTDIENAIKDIQFPKGITKEDVAAEIKAFADANPGLSLDQVTKAITTELGKLPDYATPDDVATALDNAIGKPATADAPATGLYADLAGVGEQVTELADILGTPAVADDPSTPEDESRDPTGVFRQVADAVAAGESATDALARIIGSPATGTAEASGLYKQFEDQGLDITALEKALGQPGTDGTDPSGVYAEIAKSQAALTEQIGDISATIGAPATEDAEATGVFKLIADNEAAGLSRDNAISKAIEDYARDTGVSIEALSGLVGTPATETAEATGIYGALAASEAALSGQITGVGEQVTGLAGVLGTPATADTEATGVFKIIADAEAAGIARDDAIQAIIGGPATEAGPSTGLYSELEALGLDLDTIQQTLGTPATDTTPATGLYGALETGLTGVETRLGEDITGVETRVTQQIQDVATVLGKPAQAVTQADIDLVNQMIGGQVATDLTYDANRDGVIDQSDVNFLTSITTGTEPPEFPAGTRWAPTGVYGQIAGLGADLTRQLEQQELERVEREKAIAEEAERAAQGRFQQQQRQQRVQQFMGMLTQPGALQQKVQVKAPEVMKLEQLYGGLYDPSAGLFRTPQQQQFFASPYGNYFDGGEVTEDELLAIVRG